MNRKKIIRTIDADPDTIHTYVVAPDRSIYYSGTRWSAGATISLTETMAASLLANGTLLIEPSAAPVAPAAPAAGA